MLQKRKILYIFIILIIVLISIFIINYIVKKNSFVEPKQSDFSLELKYNKDCNIIVAEYIQ